MKAFILFLSSFLFISCAFVDDSDSVFRDRGKTTTKARSIIKEDDSNKANSSQNATEANEQTETSAQTETKTPSPEEESFVFPVEITENLESLKIESSDNKRIHISAVGGNMIVLAPKTGFLSVNSLGNNYHIEIIIPNGRSLSFLLEKSKTTLKTDSKTEVSQKQAIAQTSGSAIFYIAKDGKDLVLCLGEIKAKIPIIKNLSLENCS